VIIQVKTESDSICKLESPEADELSRSSGPNLIGANHNQPIHFQDLVDNQFFLSESKITQNQPELPRPLINIQNKNKNKGITIVL